MYGGAMRQAGILAAAGIYALEHHVGRLKDDHEHAKKLARLLQHLPFVQIAPQHVDTNIVIFDIVDQRRTPADIVSALKEQGVLINAIGGTRYRAVTHLDISSKQIDEAGTAFSRVLSA
jgi:threonine aldolase